MTQIEASLTAPACLRDTDRGNLDPAHPPEVAYPDGDSCPDGRSVDRARSRGRRHRARSVCDDRHGPPMAARIVRAQRGSDPGNGTTRGIRPPSTRTRHPTPQASTPPQERSRRGVQVTRARALALVLLLSGCTLDDWSPDTSDGRVQTNPYIEPDQPLLDPDPDPPPLVYSWSPTPSPTYTPPPMVTWCRVVRENPRVYRCRWSR